MKKVYFIIIAIILFVTAFYIQPVFAQSVEVGTSSSSITFDYRYNAVLEFFIQKAIEKDFEGAFEMMGQSFKTKSSLENLKTIINATGLTNFVSRKWTEANDQMKSVGVTAITGEFITPDEVKHLVTFYLIVEGETELKIADITESLSFSDLAKLAPPTDALNAMVLKDLGKITKFIKKGWSKSAYKYLSKAAKARMKYNKVRKAFLLFKAKKFNVSLPKTGVITITQGYPIINPQGLLEIQGIYQNDAGTVNFALAYDYEWQWNLGVFSFSVIKPNVKK